MSDIQVGDFVKAFDFVPRPECGDCFVLGEVVEKGFIKNSRQRGHILGYKIKVEYDSVPDNREAPADYPVRDVIIAPFETGEDDLYLKFGDEPRVSKFNPLKASDADKALFIKLLESAA